MAFSSYSTTPSSNTTIAGLNIAENCPAGNINNAIRQLMADGKTLDDTVVALTSTVATKAPIGGTYALSIPAIAMQARPTSGPGSSTSETTTNKVVLATLDFDASTNEYAQFTMAMPKSWDEGTVQIQFLWTASDVGDVVWAAQGLALSDDDAIDAAFGAAQTVTDSVTAAGDLMASGVTGAITIGGSPAENDFVVFQIYRDAADSLDTLAVDARLVGVRLFITTNAADDS